MTRLLHFTVCCFLALALCATRAHADADIQILGESDTLLIMTFTDAQSSQTTITFTRGAANELWMANMAGGNAGIIFGGGNATYAGTSRLRALGISATQAVRTFDSSIANRPFDNMTIFRLYGGDIAITLWQDTSITEIWFVGAMVADLLIPEGPDSTCQGSLNACCKIKTIGTQEYPWPSTSNCAALLAPTSPCGMHNQACNCLSAACAFCFGQNPSSLCESVPGLEDRSAAACAMHTSSSCEPGAGLSTAATELLVEILDRTQVIRDIG